MARKEQKINLVFHLPDDEDALQDIQRRIAKVQAEAVIKYVDSLPIPLSQKQKLVDDIIADANARAEQAKKEGLSSLPKDMTIVWEKARPKGPDR